MQPPATPESSSVDDDEIRLPDGSILTPERAAEAGQRAIDEARSRRSAA